METTMINDTMTAFTGSYPGKVETARCRFCGHDGIYGKDIVDEDYRDRTGHDTTVTACKDINACFRRQGK